MVNQTSSAGSLFKSYTTHAPLGVTVAAGSGYRISNVTVNGVSTSLPQSPYATFVQGMAAQSVFATFAPDALSVTASASAGGSVSPASVGNIYPGSKLTSPLVFSFSPASGYRLASLGGATGATVSVPLPAEVGRLVTVTFAAGYSFSAPVSLSGTFNSPYPVANAGTPQTVTTGSLVTLTGGYSGGTGTPPASYSWSQLSGPAPLTLARQGNLASFTAVLPGSYQFKLILDTGSSAVTSVIVSDSLAVAARSQCQSCHLGNSIGPPSLFASWSSSKHRSDQVMCFTCHVGSNSGGHPGTLTAGKVNQTSFNFISGANFCASCHNPAIVSAYNASPHPSHSVACSSCHQGGVHNSDFVASACDGCHKNSSGNVERHPIAIGTTACISCHDPHSTAGSSANMTAAHFNNLTGAGYPASYLNSRSSCSDCHYYEAANRTIREQWGASGHAAGAAAPWSGIDFKTRSGCVRCHTTTGFIAYSTGKITAAWGTASDKTKELLSCIGCHQEVATGALRPVAPIKPFADDGYLNRNVGSSNLCMSCHSGTNNGKSIQIKVGASDFGALPFISPHYYAAGGVLHGQAGYHFPGRAYSFYSSNTHRGIGSANNNGTGSGGPCVACHMSAPNKHLYQPVTVNAAGTITGLSTTVCVNCHQGYLDAPALDADRLAFDNALDVLKAMLAKKGFLYRSDYPHFSNTNWGTGQAGANVMGAAFNYVLLASDPGAYAHNSQYAKQLVLDSIDYLDNTQFDDSLVNLALPGLLDSQSITQAAATSFISYKSKSLCTSCHGGSSATTSPMSSTLHPAHLSKPYGPGQYLGSGISSCQACHSYGAPLTHANGTVDLATGAGSPCQGCHAGPAPAWNSNFRVGCTVCHAAAPAQLPNGVKAPYKGYFLGSGHGQFASSNQCTACHDSGSSHISGSLGSFTRLIKPNDNRQCASCHDTAAVGVAFRNMSSHVLLDCRVCHDPHGTPNLAMIRTRLNNCTTVYTDRENGLVNFTNNRGVCQACHTKTTHYLAGVPETGHYSSGCLDCHRHNSAGGAFRPSGGCDACHGYPPAPRNVPVSFGTAGSWASARYEDYSGGGGAHLVPAHVAQSALATDGWSRCSVCHNAGSLGSTPYHKMSTPVQKHLDSVSVLVDPRLRFDRKFGVYTGASLVNAPARNATGSCYNISCHMSPSAPWSTER
jgi:hypothetical protein